MHLPPINSLHVWHVVHTTASCEPRHNNLTYRNGVVEGSRSYCYDLHTRLWRTGSKLSDARSLAKRRQIGPATDCSMTRTEMQLTAGKRASRTLDGANLGHVSEGASRQNKNTFLTTVMVKHACRGSILSEPPISTSN